MTGIAFAARRLTGDWGHYRVGLTPAVGNAVFGRGGFMLHGGNTPGSKGCIDVGSGESKLFPLLQAGSGPVTVIVNYSRKW